MHEIHISKRALKGPKFVGSLNLAAMMMSKLFEVFQQMNMIFGSKSNPYGILKLWSFRICVFRRNLLKIEYFILILIRP